MRRQLSGVLVVLVLAVVASGCGWAQYRFGASHTGFNPSETTVGVNNVAQLVQKWKLPLGEIVEHNPIVAYGVVYIALGLFPSNGTLYAIDATTGTVRWTAPLNGPDEALGLTSGDGLVFIETFPGQPPPPAPPTPNVFAFDAAGTTHCSGTPKTCAPLWSASAGPYGLQTTPLFANGVLYVGSSGVYAYNASNGTLLRTYDVSAQSISDSPTVVNGVLYTSAGTSQGQLIAYDANGKTNCFGAPVPDCKPLWSGGTGGYIDTAPAVTNGVAYVTSENGKLYAFDAAGTTHCSGTPKTCAPLWSAAAGPMVNTSPAIANGVVYVSSRDGKLYAFDAAGNTNCSGFFKACAPLWTATIGTTLVSSPSVANGVVYVGSDNNTLDAFDASGATNCSGIPKTCTPIWTATFSFPAFSDIAITNGMVYFGSDDDNLYAYGLP